MPRTMTCSDFPADLVRENSVPALLSRTDSEALGNWAPVASCASPTGEADIAPTCWARTASCATPSEDIAPTCWARTASCAPPVPEPVAPPACAAAGKSAVSTPDADAEVVEPVLCKKRSRSELLAESGAENISNELGVGEEDGSLPTTEEEDAHHLSPRCLFPEPAESMEEGELPPDHPDAIYDTTDLVGRHRNSVFTNQEAADNPSQIY